MDDEQTNKQQQKMLAAGVQCAECLPNVGKVMPAGHVPLLHEHGVQ